MTGHRLVLVGGGHTHVQVIRALAERPEPGVAVTLVTDRLLTPYSGMLPGHVAGLYGHDQMHIDLARLAGVSGARLVTSAGAGIDRARRVLFTGDGSSVPYDTLSLNVGVTPDLSGIVGAGRHGIPVKPIGEFLASLEELLAAAAGPDGPRRVVLVGGGAAGVELALALHARLGRLDPRGQPFRIAIATGNGLVSTLNPGVRQRVRSALARHGVEVHDDFRVVEIDGAGVRARDGRFLPADAVLVSTAARAPAWLAGTGLATDAGGFVLTTPQLTSIGDPAVFAVGDCATPSGDPMPKAGVFAVRQGAALTMNLRRRARGEALVPHRQSKTYLTILMTGDGSAIAGRGGWFAVEGRWVWRWKDWIDQRFMKRFNAFRR